MSSKPLLGQDDSRTIAAAKRCGARPEVWHAVHNLHRDRKRVVVETNYGSQMVGAIVSVSDDGFSLGDGFALPWPQAITVRAQEG